MRIDPRDFIMTPYLPCPKCGKDAYGVLSVSDTRCVRRCRECWHTGTQYLPKIRKKIVYIDQSAFSNIMKVLSPREKGHERAASEPFWTELFEILSVVCHLQLVACPDSREHQHESLASPFYKTLKRTYEHFSAGTSFEDYESVRIRQVGRTARCWVKGERVVFDLDAEAISSEKVHAWGRRIYVTVDGLLPGTLEDLRSSRSRNHELLQAVFTQWQSDKKSFAEVYCFEKAGLRRQLIHDYAAALRKRTEMVAMLVRGEMPPLNDILPTWAENQMQSLQFLFEREVGPKEALPKLREFLESQVMDEAPVSVIAAAMLASLAVKAAAGQKELPNQGTATDIKLVSMLLPYCDAMFVDNKTRALLQDIPKKFELPYPCRVFSLNSGADFIRYLTEIRDSATPEHLKLVEEVYGPNPLRPQSGIHGVGTLPEKQDRGV
jgi:hypothetical protein